jgi:flagellar biosynthesis chaperone FliJ
VLQASADCQHYQAVVSELQQQLTAAQQRCQQLEQQLASLVDSHAQELEQVRDRRCNATHTVQIKGG